MKKSIICDLDGTLFDITHRLHFIKGEKKDWTMFNTEIQNDKVNEWCFDIVKRFMKDHEIFFVTGRMQTDIAYDKTLNQIHNLFGDSGNRWTLHMREDEDYRRDCVIKKEIYDIHIKPFNDVVFCIDDRQQVVDMWRAEGLVCLQCAKGDF